MLQDRSSLVGSTPLVNCDPRRIQYTGGRCWLAAILVLGESLRRAHTAWSRCVASEASGWRMVQQLKGRADLQLIARAALAREPDSQETQPQRFRPPT